MNTQHIKEAETIRCQTFEPPETGLRASETSPMEPCMENESKRELNNKTGSCMTHEMNRL